MKSDVCVADFMKLFQEKIVYGYIGHTHRARWLDGNFKLCKDTFPMGIIVSVVIFYENYTLRPQNKVQPMYYNSIQVSNFVHIAFIHAHHSTEDDRKILREYHLYINDDQSHSIEFVQGCFRVFYENLWERGERYNQHIIWSNNCTA